MSDDQIIGYEARYQEEARQQLVASTQKSRHSRLTAGLARLDRSADHLSIVRHLTSVREGRLSYL